jgi:hypothetical protein
VTQTAADHGAEILAAADIGTDLMAADPFVPLCDDQGMPALPRHQAKP